MLAPLCRKHSPCSLQEVSYSGDRRVRLHPRVKLMETVDAASRGQVLGQLHSRSASVRGGVQITLFTGSSESVGQMGQVDLPVAGEGLVEHGDAVIE